MKIRRKRITDQARRQPADCKSAGTEQRGALSMNIRSCSLPAPRPHQRPRRSVSEIRPGESTQRSRRLQRQRKSSQREALSMNIRPCSIPAPRPHQRPRRSGSEIRPGESTQRSRRLQRQRKSSQRGALSMNKLDIVAEGYNVCPPMNSLMIEVGGIAAISTGRSGRISFMKSSSSCAFS